MNTEALIAALEASQRANAAVIELLRGGSSPSAPATAACNSEEDRENELPLTEDVVSRLSKALIALGDPKLVTRIELRPFFGSRGIPYKAWLACGYTVVNCTTRPSDAMWSINNGRHHGTDVYLRVDFLEEEIRAHLRIVAKRMDMGELGL